MTTGVVDTLSIDQVTSLMALYANEWWTNERTVEDVRRMLGRTPIVRGLVDDGELIGFARVAGDLVYHAILLDVIVRRDRRGTGLGDILMASILDDPRLGDLRGAIMLGCRDDKVAFYERWGFEAVDVLPVIEPHGGGVTMRRRAACETRPPAFPTRS